MKNHLIASILLLTPLTSLAQEETRLLAGRYNCNGHTYHVSPVKDLIQESEGVRYTAAWYQEYSTKENNGRSAGTARYTDDIRLEFKAPRGSSTDLRVQGTREYCGHIRIWGAGAAAYNECASGPVSGIARIKSIVEFQITMDMAMFTIPRSYPLRILPKESARATFTCQYADLEAQPGH
jgi:hypothetical protein